MYKRQLLKTDSASSWNQDKLADFGKKTRKEARALVKGGGGAAGAEGEDEIDTMDTDEVIDGSSSRRSCRTVGDRAFL